MRLEKTMCLNYVREHTQRCDRENLEWQSDQVSLYMVPRVGS